MYLFGNQRINVLLDSAATALYNQQQKEIHGYNRDSERNREMLNAFIEKIETDKINVIYGMAYVGRIVCKFLRDREIP